MALQPPNVNGVMDLTPTEQSTILAKLQAIQTAFVPNDFQTVADTFYITSTYNTQNPTALINGDTCNALLGSVTSGA